MDYRDLTNLMIKLAGIVIITYTIIEIPTYISYYLSLQENSFLTFVGISLLPMVIPFVAGFLFLFFPSTVTNKVIRSGVESNNSAINSKEVERIAFSTLGLFLLFHVISNIFYHGTTIYIAYKIGDAATTNSSGYEVPYALLVSTIAEFFFAIYLFFGAASLVKLLAKLRGKE